MSKREIKFRVWDIEAGKYVSGFPVGESTENGFNVCGILEGSYTNTDVIIEQYTGLLDKNGVEIYEGDLLSEKWKCEVYKNDEGTFMVKFHNNPQKNKPESLKKYLKSRERAGTSDRDNIIIGNIHQNHELI